MRLTAINLKHLRSTPRKDLRDEGEDGCPGLVLRVGPKGPVSWSILYSYRGQDRRMTIGKAAHLKLSQARATARLLLAEVALGRDPATDRSVGKQKPAPVAYTIETLGAYAMKHLPHLQPATRKEYERVARVEINPVLGALPVGDLTKQMVRDWSELIAQRAPYLANRAYEVLRRFYSIAIERDLILTTPFVKGLKEPTREKECERVLSADELWALQRALDRLDSGSSDVVRLLLWTGVRREMVLGAARAEFEGLAGKEPRWIIPRERMKADRVHVVPLSRPAAQLVRRRFQANDSEYLFPAGEISPGRPAKRKPTRGWQSSYIDRVRKHLAEILGKPVEDWKLHNLRQTVATHLREDLHVPVDVVSLILSHLVTEGSGTTRIYNRAKLLPERRDALEAWASWLADLPDPRRRVVSMQQQKSA